MGLFGKKKEDAAKAELEREIRQLEQEQEIESASQQAFIVMSNINFAERLKLINEEDANQYRVRTQQLFNEWGAARETEKQRLTRNMTEEQRKHEEKAHHMNEYRKEINDARLENMQAGNESKEQEQKADEPSRSNQNEENEMIHTL